MSGHEDRAHILKSDCRRAQVPLISSIVSVIKSVLGVFTCWSTCSVASIYSSRCVCVDVLLKQNWLVALSSDLAPLMFMLFKKGKLFYFFLVLVTSWLINYFSALISTEDWFSQLLYLHRCSPCTCANIYFFRDLTIPKSNDTIILQYDIYCRIFFNKRQIKTWKKCGRHETIIEVHKFTSYMKPNVFRQI